MEIQAGSDEEDLLHGLSTDYVSETVHQAVLALFFTFPPDSIANPNIPMRFIHTDQFFDFYYRLICNPTDGTPGHSYFPKSPRFIAIVEEFILFYIDTIYPYFKRIRVPVTKYNLNPDPRVPYIQILELLGGYEYADAEREAILRRWKAGLMREEQVLLLGAVMRGFLKQLRVLINDVETTDEAGRLTEMQRQCRRTYNVIEKFVGAPDFRSERLEVLLLRYLEEGESTGHVDVVRGLDAAQRRFEDENVPKMELDFSNWFQDSVSDSPSWPGWTEDRTISPPSGPSRSHLKFMVKPAYLFSLSQDFLTSLKKTEDQDYNSEDEREEGDT